MSPNHLGCPFMVLGLQRDASEAEVRAKYKKLAMLYHPDKNSGHSAVAEMSKINHAKDKIDAIFEAKRRAKDNPNQSSAHTCSADFFQAWEKVFGESFHSFPKPFTTKNTNPWSHATQNTNQANPWAYGSQNTSTSNPWPRRTGIWTPGSSYRKTSQQEEQERARQTQEAERLAAERAEAERRAEMERRHAVREQQNAARQRQQEQASEEEEKSEEKLIREHNERLDKIYAKHAAKKLAEQTKRQTAQWAKQQCQQQRSESSSDDDDRQRRESHERKAHANTMFAEEPMKDSSAQHSNPSEHSTATSIIQDDEETVSTNSNQEDEMSLPRNKKRVPVINAPDSSRPGGRLPVQEQEKPKQEQQSNEGIKTNHENHSRDKSHHRSNKHVDKSIERKTRISSQQKVHSIQEQHTLEREQNPCENAKMHHEDRSRNKPHRHGHKNVNKINEHKAQIPLKQEEYLVQNQQIPGHEQEGHAETKTHNEDHPQNGFHIHDTRSTTNTRLAKASARAGLLREVQRRQNRQQNIDMEGKTAQRPHHNGPPNRHPGTENLNPLATPFTMPMNKPTTISNRKWRDMHQNKKRAMSKQRDIDENTFEKPSKRIAPDSEARNMAHQRMKHALEAQKVSDGVYQGTEWPSSQFIPCGGNQGAFMSSSNPPPSFNNQYVQYGPAQPYMAHCEYQQPPYPFHPMMNSYYYNNSQNAHCQFMTSPYPGEPYGFYQNGFYYDTELYPYYSACGSTCSTTFIPTW